jgi:mono/diheme cytochrome c family protein
VTRLNDDDAQKVFASANFLVDDHVEVHGFGDDQGGVRATRVFRKPAGTGEFESKGFVTALGATSFGLSLTPGGAAVVTVNFTGSLPAGTANGSFVEVKSAAAPVGAVVTATLIRLEDKLGVAGEKVEVEGIVSSGTLASFVINGQTVVTSASTVFEGGVSGDFAVGVKLEAEGPLNANGAIAATKISFRSNIRIEADATAVTATSLSVLGRTVAINQFTRIDNGPVVDGHVEVRAIADRDGNLVATRIVVQGASTRTFLQGPVTAADSAAGTLTILGNTIVSDANTEWRVSSTSTEVPVSRAAFFAQIVANASVVKVRWDPFISLAGAIEEAEIETSATTPAPTTTTTTGATTSTTTTGATTSTTATGATTTTTATTPTTTTTTASTTTTTLAALNGATLYATNCANCHNPLAASEKRGASAAAITAGIAGVASMRNLILVTNGAALTPAQIAAIATALQ